MFGPALLSVIVTAIPLADGRLPHPNHALALVEADIATVAPVLRPFTRYVWLRKTSHDDQNAVLLTCNYISRNANLVRREEFPVVGDGHLVRVDLLQLAGVDLTQLVNLNQRASDDVVEIILFWERFRFDPSFSALITKDSLAHLRESPLNVPRSRWKADKGLVREVVFEDVTRDQVTKFDVLRLNGFHVDPARFVPLQTEMATLTPVVEAGYFMSRALSSIKDDGPYATVFGGLYYDFVGIKKNETGKGTDEDLFFEQFLGIGNIEGGVTAEKIFDRLRSDQRSAMFHSEVTAKPRRIDWFNTLNGRDGVGICMVTHDAKDKDIDVRQHPLKNLDRFEDAARELIATKANGLRLFVLFDGKGALQVEAPPDVVVDHSIPTPYTKRLQPAISCIRCHDPVNDGWMPAPNEVTALRKILKIANDDDLRLKRRYKGNADPVMRLQRDAHAKAVLEGSGLWRASKDQADVTKVSGRHIAGMYEAFWYTQIDAAVALTELGFVAPEKKELEMLTALLPPVEPVGEDRLVLEDVTIGALKAGLKVNRTDWSFVYSFAAARAEASWKAKKK